MSRKTTGLQFDEKAQVWIIDKKIKGQRVKERTRFGKGKRTEAERRLIFLSEQLYQNSLYGVRPKRKFRDAAVKYLIENQQNKTIDWDEAQLSRIDSIIGDTYIDEIHIGCVEVQSIVAELRKNGRKTKTINSYLEIIRRILNKAAYEWRDENNLTWLDKAPRIKLLEIKDARPPQPISWSEQNHLLPVLADHLAEIVLFIINTGARSGEACQLNWDWEVIVPHGLAFLIPDSVVKGNTVGERLLICNDVAASVVNRQRGKHPTHVFTYQHGKQERKPLLQLSNSAWRKGRKLAGLDGLHIHDLRHTFGYRLRQAGVDTQTRRELLGHCASDMTEHYSMADIELLYQATNKIVNPVNAESVVTLRRRKLALVG